MTWHVQKNSKDDIIAQNKYRKIITNINDHFMLLSNIITLKEQQTRYMAMKCECALRTSKSTFSIKWQVLWGDFGNIYKNQVYV